MPAIDVRGGMCGACGGPLVTLPHVTFLLCLACGGFRQHVRGSITRSAPPAVRGQNPPHIIVDELTDFS